MRLRALRAEVRCAAFARAGAGVARDLRRCVATTAARRARADRGPIDEDLLALLPSGADAVVDVDMEQLRSWPPARRFLELLPREARARLAAARRRSAGRRSTRW